MIVCIEQFCNNFSAPPGSSALPKSFKLIRNLWNGTIALTEVGKMKVVNFKKEVIPGNASDLSLAYVGFKTHNEATAAANTFLAFRCKDPSDAANCPTLPFKALSPDAGSPDLVAAWDDAKEEYTVADPPDGGHQVSSWMAQYLSTTK